MYLHMDLVFVKFASEICPRNGLFALFAVAFTAQVGDHGNQRQKHRDDNAADDDGQKTIMDRFQKRSHGRHGIVHLFVVIVGNLEQHFRHGTGLFADVHHADDHRRKHARSFERRGDSFAFLDTFVNLGDSVGDDDVAGGLLDDGQGLQNRHAAGDERASVRVNREMETLVTTCPVGGIFNLTLSQA